MNNIAREGCEFAAKLLEVERRLCRKAQNAENQFAVAGYAQASLEIARESVVHFRSCPVCQAAEAREAA